MLDCRAGRRRFDPRAFRVARLTLLAYVDNIGDLCLKETFGKKISLAKTDYDLNEKKASVIH